MNISNVSANVMPGLTSHRDVPLDSSFTNFLSLPPYPINSNDDNDDPLPLPERFARLKRKLVAGHEAAITESWYRLLRRLREEADRIAAVGTDIIPIIDYVDIHDPERAAVFAEALKQRGVAVVRRVVPPNVAATWKEETLEYVDQSPRPSPPRAFATRPPGQCQYYPAPTDDGPQMFDLYWSPGQVRARADSRMLEAQRFVMRAAWHDGGRDDALVSTDHPVAYADRFRVRRPGDTSMGKGPHVDGGSVERWEPDGYGRGRGGGTYRKIFEGRWEEHDPWDSSARLAATSDLYNGAGACSMFRMFQGWLALSPIAPGDGTLLVCPMLQLTTAYLLLRPFFQPRFPNGGLDHDHGLDFDFDFGFSGGGSGGGGPNNLGPGSGPGPGSSDDIFHSSNNHHTTTNNSNNNNDENAHDPDYHYLHESNWTLQPRPFDSVVQGAVPGHIQELSDALHPHLRLGRQTLVPIPQVQPGDWVVWHPDLVHAAEALHGGRAHSTALYIPACPLTQTNALYLARQRRAFLLGLPAPDFFGTTTAGGGGGGSGMGGGVSGMNGSGLGGAIVLDGGGVVGGGGTGGGGETAHLGRPGVQDINDAGGEDGLRAMGLLAFDEPRAASRVQREVVRLANGILFPDRFDMGYKRVVVPMDS